MPEVWARAAAAQLATGSHHLDEDALRDDLLEVWRAAVVADRGLDDWAHQARRSGRLVERPHLQRPKACLPDAVHIASAPGSLAVHLRPDAQTWTAIPPRAAGGAPDAAAGEPVDWATSTAARLLDEREQAEVLQSFLRTRLLHMWQAGPASPTSLASLSLIRQGDPRLPRLDISLEPRAGAGTRPWAPAPSGAGFVEVDSYAHRVLGPADRVLHLGPPRVDELWATPSTSTLRWSIGETTDLVVVLTTRCAESLLDLLPSMDALVATLEVCPASMTSPDPVKAAAADDDEGAFRDSTLRFLDPETRARYQVFAENFIRGLGRLPPHLEPYRALLDGAREATDAEIAELRAMLSSPDSPFGDCALLLLQVGDPGSAESRTHPLTYCTVGSSLGVFAHRSGTRTPPSWYDELLVNPDVSVEIAAGAFAVRARVLDAERREAIWEEQKAHYPGLAAYETRTRPVIPVVMLDRR